MKTIVLVFGIVAILAGLGMLVKAVTTPGQYQHTDNAVVSTAIYAEATFYAAVSIACFALATVCVLGSQDAPEPKPYYAAQSEQDYRNIPR